MLPFQSMCVCKVKFNNWEFEYELGAFSGAYDGISLGCIALQENMIFQKVQLD